MNKLVQADNTVHRYQYIDEGKVVGFIEYYVFGDIAMVTHTEVLSAFGGKGYGSKLAGQALQYFKSEKKQVVPVCGFFAQFIRKHQGYADVVTPESKRIFNI